jgi:16S rRNA (cytosine1407-C5)-methyltransferase
LSQVSNKIQDYLNSLYGKSSAKKYLEFINEEPTQYLRVNKLKTTREKLSSSLLQEYEIKTELVKEINTALKVIEGKKLSGKTIEHIIGEYYIQGLSSMIPPIILDPKPNDVVLDLCAAPGSKTTELGEIMNNKGTLVANEVQLDRLKMLVYNIDRINLVNTGVTHTKGEWLSKNYADHFDKILVDAPCSGLGIIQKKGEVGDWWSLERAEKLGDLQIRLLIAAIKMVKTGGEIVYSTCTLTPEENELILNRVLDKYPVEVMEIDLPVKSHPAFTNYNGTKLNQEILKGKRVLPWEADTDGFFIIKLKKISETIPPVQTLPAQRELKLISADKKEIRSLLNNISDYFGIPGEVLSSYKYLLKSNDIFLISKEWDDPYPGHFQRIGTKLGIIDKNKRLTLHTQAAQVFQNHISKNIYQIENQDELKKYLEGAIIKKEIEIEGQCVIKYKDFILGTAVVTKGGIKSRFPRAKRTQEIYTDF